MLPDQSQRPVNPVGPKRQGDPFELLKDLVGALLLERHGNLSTAVHRAWSAG